MSQESRGAKKSSPYTRLARPTVYWRDDSTAESRKQVAADLAALLAEIPAREKREVASSGFGAPRSYAQIHEPVSYRELEQYIPVLPPIGPGSRARRSAPAGF